jgi:hypothetical protein
MSMIAAIVLALCWPSVAAADESALRFRPAHWVEGHDIEPTFHVSPFSVLAFPSPTEGWMAGERYVLHIRGDRLEVAFVELGHSLRTFGFSNPTRGWAGAQDEENGPLLSYRDGVWRRERPAGIAWPYWGVYRVLAGQRGDAWATAWFTETPPDTRPYPTRSRGYLRYDGVGWTVDEMLAGGRPGLVLSDACQAPDGSWWFVGRDDSVPSGTAMVVARWSEGTLDLVAGPATGAERSSLGFVRCLPDGSAWALGNVRPAKDRPSDILLMRYSSGWERVPVPPLFPREPTAAALAPVSGGEVWLSASCESALRADCCSRFLHYRDGSWETVGVPLMPGGRCTKVSIDDMQFVSPDEGWAVGTDLEPRLGGGRIFHYANGTWRLRNWNWHFWNAPWFNLFG